MNELYGGIQLNEAQSRWICRGLLDLAAVDGVHVNEEALIHELYSSSGGDVADLKAMAAEGFDPVAATDILRGDLVEGFLMSCYMLIYADGHQSDEERGRIAEYAAAMGVDEEKLREVHTRARLCLLQMLAAGIRNPEAIGAAGSALGLTPDEIAGVSGKED